MSPTKVRNPILLGYANFYTMYYKDIGEFQILYARYMLVTLVLIPSDFHIILQWVSSSNTLWKRGYPNCIGFLTLKVLFVYYYNSSSLTSTFDGDKWWMNYPMSCFIQQQLFLDRHVWWVSMVDNVQYQIHAYCLIGNMKAVRAPSQRSNWNKRPYAFNPIDHSLIDLQVH